MGLFTTSIKTLDDLFVHTLQDMYYAENQITKSLPKMIEKATDPQLKQGFQTHLRETENQVKRLEQVSRCMATQPRVSPAKRWDGILTEAKQVMSDVGHADVLDAAMLSAAQAVEHYEITRYGTFIALAKQLGHADCAKVLEQTVQEEKDTERN